jgi:ABC-2 type transport system permease protein
VQWTPGKIAVLLWALLSGVCFFMGLIIIQATIAFWTVESLEIMNVLTYGGIETAQFPMTIYLPWFRKFFTFVVPLACVNYFPILLILEKPDPLGTTTLFQCLAPAAGILFLLIGVVFWNIGLRHYSSTGS